MKGLDFGRYALSAGLAMTLLSGCGGSQPPIAPSDSHSSSLAEPLGTYSSLYSFQAEPDGQRPEARLFPFNGSLYGVASIGGVPGIRCKVEGCGTVFKITTTGHETVLHRFRGVPNDGAEPLEELAALKQDLYGTTYVGGQRCENVHISAGCGTVFKLDPSGTEHMLYSFKGMPDGAKPESPLILLGNIFYGTTSSGGRPCILPIADGCGTVYTVTASGQENVLYQFKDNPDGAVPTGDLTLLNGKLYGTTLYGGACKGGTIFAITPGGRERVVYSAGCVAHDMASPSGLLSMDGVLYGSSLDGGEKFGGTVYAVTPGGDEHIIVGFNQTGQLKGDRPSGRLIAVDGLLYGTAEDGGEKGTGYGEVYSVTRAGKLSILYRFKGAPDGSDPYAGVTDAKGVLYGTTYGGGSGCRYSSCNPGYGTVFSLTR